MRIARALRCGLSLSRRVAALLGLLSTVRAARRRRGSAQRTAGGRRPARYEKERSEEQQHALRKANKSVRSGTQRRRRDQQLLDITARRLYNPKTCASILQTASHVVVENEMQNSASCNAR